MAIGIPAAAPTAVRTFLHNNSYQATCMKMTEIIV
jgi:hypothetical protein